MIDQFGPWTHEVHPSFPDFLPPMRPILFGFYFPAIVEPKRAPQVSQLLLKGFRRRKIRSEPVPDAVIPLAVTMAADDKKRNGEHQTFDHPDLFLLIFHGLFPELVNLT
jgi:hypothetical protein